MASTKPAVAESDASPSLTITRRFAASPSTLFQAWTDPQRLARWIGPRGVKAEVKEMEVRTGAPYRIAMHLPSGEIRTVRGIYREIHPSERLVFTWAWDEEAGKAGHETLVTITFRALGAETEMTILHQRFASQERRDSHNHGWNGSFDKMAEMLAGTQA
jgi:uncharacterized protein YndB with AHSA1/START domain